MIHTRHATTDDIPAIRRVAHDAWHATYPGIISDAQIAYMLDKLYAPDVLHQNIEEVTQPLLLAVENDIILGFGAYSQEEDSAYKLRKLYLDPRHQGKGIGALLLKDIFLIVQQDHTHALRLNVNRANPARHFYEKMGFTILREEDIPFGPFFLHDYVMEKLLEKE